MKITKIAAYQVDLPLHEGGFAWSGGFIKAFDSTVVQIETDAGIVGFGEVCPLGPAYLPAYAEGVRTGIRALAPRLINEDPTQIEVLNRTMDGTLRGHPYVKSPIDMACWDIMGQLAGQPLCNLFGGRFGSDFPVYRAISQGAPSDMAANVAMHREAGYTRFQLKLGGDPDVDIQRIGEVADTMQPEECLIADANGAWLMHEAARFALAVEDIDLYIEQPCLTYEECLSIRRRTKHPFILDESIDGLIPLLRGYADAAMDVVNIKISKFGGLTKAKQARDLCSSLGIAVTIEDSCGGDIATAAVAHLAHSTPTELLFNVTDLNGYVTVDMAEGAPHRINGRMEAPAGSGLGIRPRLEALGPPIFEISA